MVIGRMTAELAVRAHGADRRRTRDHSKRFALEMLASGPNRRDQSPWLRQGTVLNNQCA
jgi:hypothetical protein